MVNKKRWLAAGLCVVALASLLLTPIPAFGKPPPEIPALEKFTDANNNKIFDNLEKRMVPAAMDKAFGVIVLFTKPLSEIDFPPVKGDIGPFDIQYQYPSINGISTTFTKGQIIAAAKLGLVKQIEYNGEMRIFLDTATLWFGVQQAWSDFGVDGNADNVSGSYSKDDIVIAVIDTGIDPNHIDLDGGKIIGWADFISPPGQQPTDPFDDNGHGTHVASIAAGEGQGSAYTGVAPGAALVGVKVLDRRGSGSWADANAGIQWVIDNKDIYGIDVLNISWGAAGSSDGTSSTEQLVNQAVAAGIVAVVSAGNSGPASYSIGVPGAAEGAITVGAMADVGEGGFFQAYFSSRGPTADERTKPDISSPGWEIMAAEYDTTDGYVEYSGTSMSSPFVAGVAGLVLHADATLAPYGHYDAGSGEWVVDADPVKDIIMGTAVDWGPPDDPGDRGADSDYGAGRLDAYAAVRRAGGFSGSNPAMPNHRYESDSLSAGNTADWWYIDVTDTGYPIAITMIMPTWSDVDFDMKLYAPDDTEVASATGTKRQETISYQPTDNVTYQLKVYVYSGAGPYFFDLSAGTAVPAVAISLTTDGTVPFGVRGLGETIDTTPGGINDVQTVRVDAGPANLYIRTSLYTDGGNTWSLGSTNGSDQVVWKFSVEGTNWTVFEVAGDLYILVSNQGTGAMQDFYLRLTTPSSSSSANEHEASVTIVAVAPP